MFYKLNYQGKVIGQGRPKFTTSPYPHAVDPAKSRHFKSELRFYAQQEMASKNGKPFTCPVTMSIAVSVKVPKLSKVKTEKAVNGLIAPTVKPDLDNIIKGVQDALNGVWYVDDKQICEIHAHKNYAEFDGIFVCCEEIENVEGIR